MFEAFIAVMPEPLPDMFAVIVLAAKLPPESRATIVDAPLAEAAVVRALATVPDDKLDALIALIAEPSPLNEAEIIFAPKLPLVSRRTKVDALLDVLPVVRALSIVPLEILEALILVRVAPLPETLVNEPVVAVTLVALTFVKVPAFGVEPPITTLLRVPPVIVTELAFWVDIVPKPVMLEDGIVSQTGAAELAPSPVWLRNFLVVVICPANLAKVLVPLEYRVSPVV
jgi:hypothetical protein